MLNTSYAPRQSVENRAERYAQAAALLCQWLREAEMEDESEYDWDAIDRELDDVSMRCREPDSHEREPCCRSVPGSVMEETHARS